MSNYIFQANSFGEYINFIKEYSQQTKYEIWYRGHSNNSWKLTANIYRNKQIDIKDDEIQQIKYRVVNFKEEFLKLKDIIIKEKLFDISELNDFNIMFLAQHHGLLTPVLDWTSDPLVALFFAIDDYKFKNEVYPVVHILKTNLINPHTFIKLNNKPINKPLCIDTINNEMFLDWINDLNETVVTYTPMAIYSEKIFSHRISKQSGKFTFHGAIEPFHYLWNDTFIDTIVGREMYVDSIKINPNIVDEIKEYLTALDITKDSIYLGSFKLDEKCDEIKNRALNEFKKRIDQANRGMVHKV